MTVHKISTIPRLFEPIVKGEKPFLVDKNKTVAPGDYMLLEEAHVIPGVRPIIQPTERSCMIVVQQVFYLGDVYPELEEFRFLTFRILNMTGVELEEPAPEKKKKEYKR